MPDTHAALKRRIAAPEEENNQLLAKVVKKPVNSYRLEGRAVRRLVDLAIPFSELISEHDHCVELGADDEASANAIQGSIEENYTYRSFKKLIHWCPSVKRFLDEGTNNCDAALAFQEVRKGGDGARGDDASSLKFAVANWLNEALPHPEPLLSTTDKSGRDLYHDATSRLLCPVNYDWLDVSIRSAVREYHPKYPVTANAYPTFLYARGQYDAENPSKGLFKGELLVKAFCCIFTSPSSAEAGLAGEVDVGSSRKAQKTMHNVRTHCDVAGLLKMSATSWNLQDEEFDYNVFYRHIVDYFEQPVSRQKSNDIKDLLLWWNRKVFGRRNASSYLPQQVEALSVALARQ